MASALKHPQEIPLTPLAPAETRAMPAAGNSYGGLSAPPENRTGTKQSTQAPGPWNVFYVSVRLFFDSRRVTLVRRTSAGQTSPHRSTTLLPASSQNITHDEHAYATTLTRPPSCRLAASPLRSRSEASCACEIFRTPWLPSPSRASE